MNKVRRHRDWSSDGVDWRDSAADEEMAKDWIENERRWRHDGVRSKSVPIGYDLDLDARVMELVETELDPERGWRLALTLLRVTEDDCDLRAVALGPLETFLRNHADAFRERIDAEARTNAALLEALDQTSFRRQPNHRRQPLDR